jgi:hypothetical protein
MNSNKRKGACFTVTDENKFPPDGEWVPYGLPWVEGRCIPEKKLVLNDGKWSIWSMYPVPDEDEDEDEDEEFMTHIITEICDYAVDNDMEPNDTLSTIADNIKVLLEISTFNGWKRSVK